MRLGEVLSGSVNSCVNTESWLRFEEILGDSWSELESLGGLKCQKCHIMMVTYDIYVKNIVCQYGCQKFR